MSVDLYGNYTAETLSLPQQWREQIWLANGETGISSKTIHAVLTGMVDDMVFNASPSWLKYDVLMTRQISGAVISCSSSSRSGGNA